MNEHRYIESGRSLFTVTIIKSKSIMCRHQFTVSTICSKEVHVLMLATQVLRNKLHLKKRKIISP